LSRLGPEASVARTVGRGRTIEQKQPVPKYKLPQELAPQDLEFFNHPKGIDVVTPLSSLTRSHSPEISNLVLDKGILRSRFGTEKYHDPDGSLRIQRTTDLGGSASQTAPQTAARSTSAQGSGAGWTDPDGTGDGKNIITGVSTPAVQTITAANRLYNIVGDPTAGSNVDAYDDKYTITFMVTADPNTLTSDKTLNAQVVIEYSIDGGANWITLSGAYVVSVNGGGGVQSLTFSPAVVVPGSPTQLRFRMVLSSWVTQSGAPSGTGTATVKVFGAAWPANANPITWTTQTNAVIAARIPIRWTETHLQTYDDLTEASAPWTTDYTFPASQLNNDNTLPTYVTWKDTVVSSDIGNVTQVGAGSRIGSQGLISTLLAPAHTTTVLPHSPRAAHLAVFGNRVIATRVNEWTSTTSPWVDSTTVLSRVRWCVKDDNTLWDETSVGAGHEDLYVPGGQTDEAMGCFPINDDTAIVVSERSTRRMDVTGFADAPFRFTNLVAGIGTRSRYTIQAVPSGVIFLSYDDVIILTLGDAKRVATKALRDSLKKITNERLAQGYYDVNNARYIVGFKEGSTQVIWTYSFLDEGWTKISLPWDVVFVDRTFYVVNGVTYYGNYFTMAVVGGFSVRDNPSLTKDIDVMGVAIDSPFEIRTGFILADTPLRKIEVLEAQLVFEATVAQTLAFEYSTDGGSTWFQYSSAQISPTVKPSVLSVRNTLETAGLQVRVRSLSLGGLKMYSLHVFAARGGLIKP